jgi:hypothetical protein
MAVRRGGDPFKKDNFKDCVIRLVAQVTSPEREARLTANSAILRTAA